MQLAHAQALREEFVQAVRSSQPLYLRKPDAEINWYDPGRTGREGERHRDRSRDGRPSIRGRCVAVTCAACSRIEDAGRTRALVARAVPGRAAATGARRAYLVARVGGRVVGYGGLLVVGDDGHVTTVAVDPGRGTAGGVGTG